MQNQTKLAIVFTLLSSTALADAPCDYMFGPDMSQMDACNHAEDRAKKGIMREIIPETLKSEKSLNCLLTNVKKSCKVIYMNTNIGKIKFMESCDER